jgi:hypothetical protein
MVLKCGNGKDWSYIDNIVTVTTITPPKEGLHETSEVYHFSGYDGGEPMFDKQLYIQRKNEQYGKQYSIRASAIYLLSDEGKTIERIN